MGKNNAAESRETESHEVVLLGKKYKLRSQHDDEYLAKLAHFVTGQVAGMLQSCFGAKPPCAFLGPQHPAKAGPIPFP